MTQIPIQLELITTEAEFELMMLQAIRDKFNSVLTRVAEEVEKDLPGSVVKVNASK